jgi:LacI family transcriptional regulator
VMWNVRPYIEVMLVVTLADVAREAKVSVATVSRVLNGTGAVKAATRARVLRAVSKLGYSVNVNARSLAVGRTRTLGIVVPDIANPYWSQVFLGMQSVALREGYTFSLFSSDHDDATTKKHVHALVDKRVDGLLLAVGIYDELLVRMLQTYRIPVVFMSPPSENIPWDCVHTDDETGSYEATKHLIERGHRCLGMITGNAQDLASQLRVNGFLRALREAGLAVRPGYIVEGNWRIDGGEKGGKILLSLPERPSAVMTANNATAVGLIKAARSMGIHIPGDITIATFGDLGLATDLFPFITTVITDAYGSGVLAVQLLLHRIQGIGPAGPQVIRLQHKLRPGEEERGAWGCADSRPGEG